LTSGLQRETIWPHPPFSGRRRPMMFWRIEGSYDGTAAFALSQFA
jgi:hypothetical protein